MKNTFGDYNEKISARRAVAIFVTAGLLFFLVLAGSCSRQKPEDEILFRIDEDLLGETYSDSLLAIEMRIPVSWDDITDELRSHAESLFESSDEELEEVMVFRKGFGNIPQVTFMLLFEFLSDHYDRDTENAISAFISQFTEDKDVLKKGGYTHNEIKFHQVTYRDREMISIMLLAYGEEQRVFALFFFIPEANYMNFIEKIESSIGSITKK